MTDATATLSQALGEFAASTTFESLPTAVVDSVKSRVLDILGIAAAAAPLDTSRAVRRLTRSQGGVADSWAVGVPERLPAAQAAFVNGVLAHSLDYDDTHLPSVLHPSASVVPAVLAAAEAEGSSGEDMIRAIAIGLEVCVRIGMAGYDKEAGNSVFFEHGQHATSICGAMGAAAGIAALSGDATLVWNSLGIAASMASGIIESNRTGGTVKRMHCGWAAHSAVVAVQLVRAGLTGPPTVLEGRFGFFEAWLHGEFDASAITDGLGTQWSVPDIFFKPYPANHFTHTAVDAAAALRRAGITPDRLQSITLGVPMPIVRTIGDPIEIKRRPETGYMAQFSGPYAIAAGLLGGGGLEVGLDDYTDELAHDALRRSIMDKVEVVADDRCTAIFPAQFPAIVTAHLTDGSTLVEEVLTNRGGPDRALSFDELASKFRDNARRTMDGGSMHRLEAASRSLESAGDVRGLLDDLSRIDPEGLAPNGVEAGSADTTTHATRR